MGVCSPWTTPEAVQACCSGLVDPPNEDLLDQAITLASNLLFRWSGRRFPGVCTRVVRPCYASNCGCGAGGYGLSGWSFWAWDSALGGWQSAWPVAVGSFFPFCGPCAKKCELPSVTLPAPVVSIDEVVIDGVVLDPSAYQVENYRKIVRVDGEGWPCSNDRTLNSAEGGDPGTWQITYSYGRSAGVDGELVCARYACELAKAFCNGEGCQLPDKVQRLVREGVTFDELSNLIYQEKGLTGIREVDDWVASVNPQGLQRRATISRLGETPGFKAFT